jgi:phosphoglycolate phosphatase
MNRIELIAFDLDGTLLDTSAGVTHALNVALERANLSRFSAATVQAWIGGGPDALILRALRALKVNDADISELAMQLRRDFDAATLATPMAEGSAYAGVPDLLAELAPQYPLVVVTNKPTALARAVLNDAGVLRHFSAVYGADTPAHRKPLPLLLQLAAQQAKADASALLMVGDASVDIDAARAAGSPAAWARWGFAHDMPQPAPEWTLEAPQDLLALLQASQHPWTRLPN